MSLRKLLTKLMSPSKARKRTSTGSTSFTVAPGETIVVTPLEPGIFRHSASHIEPFLDPNPYKNFLLCPKHATRDLVMDVYRAEIEKLVGTLEEDSEQGVKTLTRGDVANIHNRIEKLEAAKNVLMDPVEKVIADARYEDQTNCQLCEKPFLLTPEPELEAVGIVPMDEGGSMLLSYPRPGSKEWRKSTGKGRRPTDYDF